MRVAGLADAFQDAVRSMHDTRRADALGVVRHEGARGIASRVVRGVDAVLHRQAAQAAKPHGRIRGEGARGLMDEQVDARFAVPNRIAV